MSSNKIKIAVLSSTAIFFIGDRFLKQLAMKVDGRSFKLLGDWLQFNFAANKNISFSLPLSGYWLKYLIAAIIIGLIIYTIKEIKNKAQEWVLLLVIIFGAASNLYDRFRYGYVIDYLDMKYFTVFNLADAMIVISICFLLLYLLRVDKNIKPC